MSMDANSSEQKLNLAVIVEIARSLARPEAIAQAVCAHAVAGLGLASASISLVSGDSDDPRLDSVAAVGQLSSFVREMSTPLEALEMFSRDDATKLVIHDAAGVHELPVA